jgi:PhoH-like ATPase
MTPKAFFVIDTSVLLAVGPSVLEGFGDATAVLSSVVLEELESKRHGSDELGYQARRCLRYLASVVETITPVAGDYPVGDKGGTIRFELNHRDQASLPEVLRDTASNDKRILSIARALADAHPDAAVTVVSRDLPMRLHAVLELHLLADEYVQDAPTDVPSGIVTLDVDSSIVDRLYAPPGVITLDPAWGGDLAINTGVILGRGGLARVTEPGRLTRIEQQEPFGLTAKSAEQHIALAHLLDPAIPVVSLGGRAGTGKTSLALAAGLELVMERHSYSRVTIFRNLHPVGGQQLGYLPGSADEKMGPWAEAIQDVLNGLCTKDTADEILDRGLIEVLPLSHIRGRTFHDAFVIVDEAQNLELSVLATVMTRLADTSKIVLTHDVAQRDNLHVGRHDGVAVVVDRLLGSPLFAHVTLNRTVRSKVAELVSSQLDIE